jgi:hypothetical protein
VVGAFCSAVATGNGGQDFEPIIARWIEDGREYVDGFTS